MADVENPFVSLSDHDEPDSEDRKEPDSENSNVMASEAESEESVNKPNEIVRDVRDGGSLVSDTDQGGKVLICRIKDGWDGVWTRFHVDTIETKHFENFGDFEQIVLDTVLKNGNKQPPHDPQSDQDPVTYVVDPEEEYTVAYLAHPANGINLFRRRQINVYALGWETIKELLAEMYFYAPGTAEEFPDYDADETTSVSE